VLTINLLPAQVVLYKVFRVYTTSYNIGSVALMSVKGAKTIPQSR
jgi:hypothetical protein